uniref:Uncharacterized protein n=1 Tax=Panagrolaimus davidi TaxID=227884 RepID=A0A914NYY4_9BILA
MVSSAGIFLPPQKCYAEHLDNVRWLLNIKLLNLRYNCMCENPTVTCLNGGYPNPHDCSSCLCPRGYDSSNRCSGVDPGTDDETPSGKRVQLIFLKGADKDESEQGGCPDNGIVVKITKSKFDRTGYM